MKKTTIIAMLCALACSSVYAQNTQATYDVQQNTMSTYQSVNDDFQQRYRQNYVKSLTDLTRLRDSLTLEWQSLGLSPHAAKAVANAYKPNLVATAHHEPLSGKSDQEIAALLQNALAKKDYMLANQTLIDYEGEQLHMKSNVRRDGHH
ncbi:hypothetical protein PY254_03715 [Rhodanobacter sp. AS-Z3]|uniref:hypothetical protein n=1 Tax=Rhodanobacter sp. AS-Z3 TaxID=3031330 RepID=UPI00247909EA|nr:hypothetical protein [Rhodanobacter sp. AS-Z3]WEN15791.1 hypothetical protein PY254_03715 [Rhodanobacter sp. AS-Z3]